MIRLTIKFLTIILLLGFISCRSARIPVRSSVINGSATAYIESYSNLAISEMKRTGVPASITLAQGMLESDYGRSTLARMGNNHFGIKCHTEWQGQVIRQNDDRRNECFRKYQRPEDSFQDHSDFLRSGSRYSFLFKLDPTDYKAWAHGLKKAGYATNPDYANLIIRKIEENNLHDLDRGIIPTVSRSVVAESSRSSVPQKSAPSSKDANVQSSAKVEETVTFGEVIALAPRIMENNGVQYIIVKDGETRLKLENEFQLLKNDLARYNDLNVNFVPVAGQVLYLEPKREKAESGKEFHITSDGETMHSISQKYAIRLNSLLELNGMSDTSKLVNGQQVKLQAVKTVN